MKVLLIDDNAYRGWKVLLEKSLNIQSIQIATDYDEAKNALEKKHHLIFLDMRLSADEKNHVKVSDYASYKLIRKIRSDFSDLNFSTPIILFSAAHETWKVKEFLEMGADAVYTKEHPSFGYDAETSRMNFKTLKEEVSKLIASEKQKNEIWSLSQEISKKIANHRYTENKDYHNVSKRINDKIKLAYKIFFSAERQYESEALFSNSASVGAIIYFSIGEEITKLFTERRQNLEYYSKSEWRYRNREYLIEKSSGQSSDPSWIYLEKGNRSPSDEYPLKAKTLSNQMYGLISSFAQCPNKRKALRSQWRQINERRNENQFIHSNIKSIYNSPLVWKKSQVEDFDSCIMTLKFYLEILSLPVT